ncbi:ATP-dependent Clp protease proteolytic subunit, partial [bacterium]|nr:ATP-dependent Clp protease proteolytic subunit [bacterium]
MAVVIDLQGEFGWQIRPKTVANKLSRVNGEDVIVRLSTGGGDVFDGADIVNLFLDFRRDNPTVKMSLEIKAIAASYGSALMAAPIWEDIGISQVSAFMMHKASTFAFVNADDLEGIRIFLSGLDNVYSQMYADRSGKTQAQALQLMSEETWYFGQEIIDQGFADKIITMDDPGGDALPLFDEGEDRNIFIVDFKNQRESMMAKQKEKAKNEKFDSKRAVACLRIEERTGEEIVEDIIKLANPGKPDDNKPAPVGNLKTEVPMNEAELKKDNPELYAILMKKGADDERDTNNARVKALTEMKAKDEYKDIPEVSEAIDKAIMDGTSVEAVQPL